MSDRRGELTSAPAVCNAFEYLLFTHKKVPTPEMIHEFLGAHQHAHVSLGEVKHSMTVLGQFLHAQKQGPMALAHVQALYEKSNVTFTSSTTRIREKKPPSAANLTKLFGVKVNSPKEKPVKKMETDFVNELDAMIRAAEKNPDVILTKGYGKIARLKNAVEGKGGEADNARFSKPEQRALAMEIIENWKRAMEKRRIELQDPHFRDYKAKFRPRRRKQ